MAAPQISKIQKLVPLLLSWFATNARDLPWRRTRDPYAIWVSEIMLQQTQVKTVIPYWERWMRELPTIESAATASPAKLHKLWEGLGYYTRVRNLQKAAQQIIARHNGSFPQLLDDLLALPGIGRYTAGAIASIAFDQPTPILDGNVIRILTRVFGIREDPREKKVNTKLWQLSEQLVTQASSIRHPASTISHLNQSLMELGALICTPRSPQCDRCPVKQFCVACKKNLQVSLPNLGNRPSSTARRFTALVIERNGKFLVRQRPAGVVNAHLWEFPNVEVGARPFRPQRIRNLETLKNFEAPLQTKLLRPGQPRSEAIRKFGFKFTAARPLCTIKHSITRYRITLEAYRARLANSHARSAGQWLTLPQLHQRAFTGAHRKILAHLLDSTERKSPAAWISK